MHIQQATFSTQGHRENLQLFISIPRYYHLEYQEVICWIENLKSGVLACRLAPLTWQMAVSRLRSATPPSSDTHDKPMNSCS
jgi:hypothetical protein